MHSKKCVKIPADVLRGFLERILVAAGLDSDNARITSDGFVEADLRGHAIQGTDHIHSTISDLKAGRVNGMARPRVVRETAATAQVDGDGATGHVAGGFATDVAIRKARDAGAAVVGLVRSNDVFMLGAYVEKIARSGLAGMAITNGRPWVHPHGGMDRVLGTNPIAFGFPLRGSDPIIIDTSTSATAHGHVRMASYDGKPLPEGIAIDQNGLPTTNASDALAGALRPLAGAKGYALGLAAALLSGPVVGGILGTELVGALASDRPSTRGHFFLAVDPAAFGDPDVSLDRTRRYIDEIKAGRKAEGATEILIPGERSFRTRSLSLSEGIELPESVWRHTLAIANELGVGAPVIR